MTNLDGRAEIERDYDVYRMAPDSERICEGWSERARLLRREHAPTTIRYGDHARETFDLFRAQGATGTLVFVHGGGWQVFSKDDFSWVASGFLDEGVSVAILNYPLCPDVTLTRIADSTRRAFAHLWRENLGERERVVVAGHSAGGYLAALHVATDWRDHGLPENPISAVVPVSGLFSLSPLVPISLGEEIGLGPDEARALSLGASPPRSRAALTLVVGEHEADGFNRQSDDLASAWSGLSPKRIDVPGRNHFDVIDDLAVKGSVLHRAVMDVLAP